MTRVIVDGHGRATLSDRWTSKMEKEQVSHERGENFLRRAEPMNFDCYRSGEFIGTMEPVPPRAAKGKVMGEIDKNPNPFLSLSLVLFLFSEKV